MATTVDRPNRDALQRGIDVYRDAVRDFIIRNLKRVKGTNVNQLLLDAAGRNPQVYNSRKERLDKGDDPRSVIDVADFPHIVTHHWHGVFQRASESSGGVRNRMYLIAEGRNFVAHPDADDIGVGYAIGRLDDIAFVMRQINANDGIRRVEAISLTLQVIPPPRLRIS